MRHPDMPGLPAPAYRRVADDIAACITAGQLTGRLPPERDLARHHGVAYGTIRHALAVLRERGLIATLHGTGSFTLPAPPAPKGSMRKVSVVVTCDGALLDAANEEFTGNAHDAGRVPPAVVRVIVNPADARTEADQCADCWREQLARWGDGIAAPIRVIPASFIPR